MFLVFIYNITVFENDGSNVQCNLSNPLNFFNANSLTLGGNMVFKVRLLILNSNITGFLKVLLSVNR